MSKKNKGLNAQQQAQLGQLQEKLTRLEQELAQKKEQLDRREEELGGVAERLGAQEKALGQEKEELDKRERAVKERELLAEPGLVERNRAALDKITRREAHCQEAEENLAAQKQELDGRETEVARKEGEIAEQKRQLCARELNAAAGFLKENRAALAGLETQREELLQELEDLNKQIAERRQARQQQEASQTRSAEDARAALEAELARTRQERMKALEEEIRTEGETRRCELTKTLQKEREGSANLLAEARATAEAELKRQREELQARGVELEVQRKQLNQDEVKLQKRQTGLEIGQGVLEEKRRILDDTIEERIRDAVKEAEIACAQRDRLIDDLRQERDDLWKQLQAFEDLRGRLGGEPEQVLERMRARDQKIEQLRQELAERPGPELRDELQTLLRQRGQWHADRETLTRELQDLRAKQDSWTMGVAERENAQRLREIAERHVETMEAQVRKLQVDVNRLRSLYEQPQEVEARVGVIEEPCLPRSEPNGETGDERSWLEQVRIGCEKSGFVFPPRLLKAFHTALKTAEWSPLAVLAGVSGTGKSELPRLYSRFGGLNYLPLSVQPNWDSPQSLFGFFNSVDNRFNATPLLQSLTQSQRAPEDRSGLEDQIVLILLDEMNLAHIELYFSDLLSKLELRRGAKESIKLEIDLGAGLKKYPVVLGRNVLWAGTMNEDETTKTLSDKVLDRGNVIVFPRPRELRRREQATLADPSPMLSRSVWDSWVRSRSTFTDEQVQAYKQILERMNVSLERAGRALGHRVWQSVEYYMANHPDVIAAQPSGDAEVFSRAMLVAFEDQLVQKVMPKLRGIETSGTAKRDCLDPIRVLLEQNGIRLLDDFDVACAAGYGGFVWRSAHYLEANP